ncbi:MAG: DNA cytosine methyltransferase [Desulfosalsimonadaceae bacterium]
MKKIPVIDIFAGPGGLGEGFSSAQTEATTPAFNLCLSIEKDIIAHKTLELRSFYRQFVPPNVPDEYYLYLMGEIARDELFSDKNFQYEIEEAKKIAWCAELGAVPSEQVDEKIQNRLQEHNKEWVLIGGPPCQAYSMVGRSKMMGTDPEKFKNDDRHFLYKEYLRILALHQPAVFIFENVKGILSTKANGKKLFDHLLMDLRFPAKALQKTAFDIPETNEHIEYNIYSIVNGNGGNLDQKKPDPHDFVVQSENFGIPQARHRVIIMGIRSDIKENPGRLKNKDPLNMWDVIKHTPKIRSSLSREPDSDEAWSDAIQSITRMNWFKTLPVDSNLRKTIEKSLIRMAYSEGCGEEYLPGRQRLERISDWYLDSRLSGICNHTSRGHIRADLQRYFFISCFGLSENRSPLLHDFPGELLPKHKNVQAAIHAGKFSDRFRVQLKNEPSKTITSHISKDGHYFIHPDPTQCRSLTVREAARIQTFPDNYFFEGGRTRQYQQVGNAVPPLLAKQIADVVYDLLKRAGKV